VPVNRECPQERVLSPLLWNMVVNGSTFRRLYNAQYQAQVYADDVVLLQKCKFVSRGKTRHLTIDDTHSVRMA
jgi:hypothetical protein